MEPVTLRPRGGEPTREVVDAHRPVIAQWGWAVCDPDVLQDNLEAISLEVSIDGQVVATGDLSGYRLDVRESELRGADVWEISWAYPMGAFESGSFHWLEVKWILSRTVTDGCDFDADGQPDTYGPGVCGVARLEVTVQ